MPIPAYTAQRAFKFELEVLDHGRLELEVPLTAGARVVVFVVPEVDEAMDDLVAATRTSLSFWDNPMDDKDWNDTLPRREGAFRLRRRDAESVVLKPESPDRSPLDVEGVDIGVTREEIIDVIRAGRRPV